MSSNREVNALAYRELYRGGRRYKTQVQMVYEYMIRYGSITQKEAATGFECYCLAERIRDLREKGYNIVSTATRGGERILAVILGGPDPETRACEAIRLLEAGFASTSSGQPFEKALEAIPACTFQPDMRLTRREALAHWGIQPRARRLAAPAGKAPRHKAGRHKTARHREARAEGRDRTAKRGKAPKQTRQAKAGRHRSRTRG